MTGQSSLAPHRGASTSLWAEQTFYYFKQVVLVLAIPGLVLLAYRGWAKHLRKILPPWCSALGVTSILIAFLNLLALIIPFLLAVMRLNTHILTDDWIGAVSLFVVISMCLGFALRGAPRVQIILAGLLTADDTDGPSPPAERKVMKRLFRS